MDKDQIKALKHIIIHGNSRQLKAKKWKPILINLYRSGYLKRSWFPSWTWMATKKAKKWAVK